MADVQTQFVDFKCPYCQKNISFPAEWAGSAQQCLWCNGELVVPEKPKEAPHKIQLDIHTDRLFLRRLHERDRGDLLEIVSDKGLLRYLDWRTMEPEDVEEWLAEDSRFKLIKLHEYAYFGIELKKRTKLIGVVSFHYYDETDRHAQFNVIANRAFHNQGFGKEAVQGVLAFAFQEMNLHRVVAMCDSRNTPGLKMLESAMRREGEAIESRRVKDEWVNTVHYAKLRREWRGLAAVKSRFRI